MEEGELTVNGRDVALPYGSRGGYDRTAGHRPRHQNWNWLASTGTATTHEGQEVRFAVQFAKDQALATPTVAAQKYTVWVDSHLVKVHEASFTRSQNPTSPGKDVWTICGHGPGPISEIELRVQTRFHRREHRRVPGFVHVDFNQYYGPLTGTFRFGCQSYVVQEAFSVIEDLLLVL